VNQELYSATIGAKASFSGRPVLPESILLSGADDGFQRLQLRLASAAAQSTNLQALLDLFCREAREFFQVSGVYFWRSLPGNELLGEQAAGKFAERFAGMRVGSGESLVTAEAVRQRRAVFVNHVDPAQFPAAAEFGARSLLSAPLLVFNGVIGAISFLHDSDDSFFNEDFAAKASVLAGQLGNLLEAMRLRDVSLEEHRRVEILAEVAHALHGNPDVAAVVEALADRMRLLLRTRLVCVLLKREGPFELRAVSAETPQLANAARARHDRQTLRFAAELAQRAISAGEPISLSIGAEVHSLGNLISPGVLLAAPLRTAQTQGAILVYPREEAVFTPDEKALVSAIAGFGAVAIANAELAGDVVTAEFQRRF
jgi:GAF domain-containing protein